MLEKVDVDRKKKCSIRGGKLIQMEKRERVHIVLIVACWSVQGWAGVPRLDL